MRFLRRHPVLTCVIWEMAGLLIIGIGIVYCGLTFDKGINMPFFVFTLIGGILVMAYSPFIIYHAHKSEQEKYFNRLIQDWYTKEYGRKTELFATFLTAFIFLALAGAVCRLGWGPLLPFAAYAAAPVYLIWKRSVKRKFYQVRHAERYCRVISVQDISFLDIFYNSRTIMYVGTFDDRFFDFIYNHYGHLGILKKQEICFYRLDYALLNAKYGFRFQKEKGFVLCITGEEVVMDERILNDGLTGAGGYIYYEYINNAVSQIPV